MLSGQLRGNLWMEEGMDVLEELTRVGAVLHGHFELSSGRHSDVYFEKFRLLEQPAVLRELCRQLVEPFADQCVQLVVGPTIGGALVACEAAGALGVQARYLERSGSGGRELRRGAVIPEGTRVLLVDDVLTTGLSLQECLLVLRSAELIGIAVLIARTESPVQLPVAVHALATLQAPSYAASECPMCHQGVPITKPGSRGLLTG